MSGISTSIQVTDQLSPAFRTMTQSINACLGSFVQMQAAAGVGVDTDSLYAAQIAMEELNWEAARIDEEIRAAATAQTEFNDTVRTGEVATSGLLASASALAAVCAGTRAVVGIAELSDSMAQTTARLNLMNDGLQTTYELQEMIYEAAQNSRGVYADTANVVSRLGLLAEDAFSSNSEMIQFAELMNKNFKIAGASAQEQSSAMYQLTQAMAAGKLQGDEYRSIIENAPLLASAIEDYMVNVQGAQGSMKDWASEGLLTADVIKAAMFSAADEINEKFEEIPMTWSGVAASVQNTALMTFQPVLQEINELAANANTQTVVEGIMGGMATIAAAAEPVLNLMINGASLVVENWDMISPVLYGAGAAMLFYLGVTKGAILVHSMAEGVTTAFAAAQTFLSVGFGVLTGNTTAAATAMELYNATLLACPATWVVFAIIGIITILYAGVAAFNHFTDSSISATGIIAGAFAVLGAFIYNTFYVPFYNMIASAANFLGNVFFSPVAAIKVLFYDLAITVMGLFLNISNAIENVLNAIPGVAVDIDAGLTRDYNKFVEASQQVRADAGWTEYIKLQENIDYGTAWTTGYNFGSDIASGFSEKISGIINNPIEQGDYDIGATAGDTAATAANTGKIADNIELSSEDLKYLRDIAERDVIDRTVFRDIKVDLGGVVNNVTEMRDLDGIAEYLGEVVQREMLISAEGVH